MITFVVVLYSIPIGLSTTVSTLLAAIKKFPDVEVNILVADNSPDQSPFEVIYAPNVCYLGFGKNLGIARAYNIALERAVSTNSLALITLDQDSHISVEYLGKVFSEMWLLDRNCVALCPRVRSGPRIISPFGFNWLGLPRYGGILAPECAINSYSVYSVKYLASVGGFDEYYWLDALDLSVFAKISRSGFVVRLLDVTVDHELSLVSGQMSKLRMINMARFEASFLVEYRGLLHVMSGIARLIARIIRVQWQGGDLMGALAGFVAMYRGASEGGRRRFARS
jgi:GT2 family glycosyltransferase